ncbi:hypothetical protein PGT21_013793 [Puccinia graminis f. sp. tritici]|uniref:Uncharacterized protein n=1 Tax=Puccinia graminis f. sp. tritici TaxID=56615 RepID=A0A5B0Q2I7_PUCGR|nr:hypothetical protein PGT21_013793 [Puccinia graminis f. sp. tritici]KAA1124760.1 hypothetical protein PGTUg99_033941 [Puccinia graminis f. sp. tritici]
MKRTAPDYKVINIDEIYSEQQDSQSGANKCSFVWTHFKDKPGTMEAICQVVTKSGAICEPTHFVGSLAESKIFQKFIRTYNNSVSFTCLGFTSSDLGFEGAYGHNKNLTGSHSSISTTNPIKYRSLINHKPTLSLSRRFIYKSQHNGLNRCQLNSLCQRSTTFSLDRLTSSTPTLFDCSLNSLLKTSSVHHSPKHSSSTPFLLFSRSLLSFSSLSLFSRSLFTHTNDDNTFLPPQLSTHSSLFHRLSPLNFSPGF